MQVVRVDPKKKLLVVEISLPLHADDPESIRLSTEAGAALLDHGPFSTLILLRGGNARSRTQGVIESVSECAARIGSTKIACVGRPAPRSPGSSGASGIVDFATEQDAVAWLTSVESAPKEPS